MLTIQQIKDTVAGYLKDKPIEQVYLFGSYARGEAQEDSDVDLGVKLKDERITLWQYLHIAEELQELLGKKVDFVEIALMHTWIKRGFETDKIEIYHA